MDPSDNVSSNSSHSSSTLPSRPGATATPCLITGLKIKKIVAVFQQTNSNHDYFDRSNTLLIGTSLGCSAFSLLALGGGISMLLILDKAWPLLISASAFSLSTTSGIAACCRTSIREKHIPILLNDLQQRYNNYPEAIVRPEEIPQLLEAADDQAKAMLLAQMNFAQLHTAWQLLGSAWIKKYLQKKQRLPGTGTTLECHKILYLIKLSLSSPEEDRILDSSIPLMIANAAKTDLFFQNKINEILKIKSPLRVIPPTCSPDSANEFAFEEPLTRLFRLAVQQRLPQETRYEDIIELIDLCITRNKKETLEYLETYILAYQPFPKLQLEEYLLSAASKGIELPRLRQMFEEYCLPEITLENVITVYNNAVKGGWEKKKEACIIFVTNSLITGLTSYRDNKREEKVHRSYALCKEIFHPDALNALNITLEKTITCVNIAILWKLATDHALEPLRTACKNFFIMNSQEILNNMSWESVEEVPAELVQCL